MIDRLAVVDIVLAVGSWRRRPPWSQRPQTVVEKDKYVPGGSTLFVAPIAANLAEQVRHVRCYCLAEAEPNRAEIGAGFLRGITSSCRPISLIACSQLIRKPLATSFSSRYLAGVHRVLVSRTRGPFGAVASQG